MNRSTRCGLLLLFFIALIKLSDRLGNLKIFLRYYASKLGNLVVLVLDLAGQPYGELLLSRSLGLIDFILGSFPGRLAQLVCHLVHLLGQNFDFLLHNLTIDFESGTFFYFAIRDGDYAFQ